MGGSEGLHGIAHDISPEAVLRCDVAGFGVCVCWGRGAPDGVWGGGLQSRGRPAAIVST